MTDAKLQLFKSNLEVRLEQFRQEFIAIVESGDWKLLRSWVKHTESEEDRAIKAILWCRFFFPHYFKDETPEFHFELSYLFFSKDNEFFAAPRGFSKTTLFQGLVSCSIAHDWETFIVVVEKTFNEASEVLSAIREEFATNGLLKEVYGDLIAKSSTGDEQSKVKDAEGDMFIAGIRLRAKGFNAPIRGLKSKQYRPSLVWLDDVEEDDHVRNEDQRRKYLENYTQGIVPALDIDGRLKVSGTILHQDSLLKNLIDQHGGKVYSAFDPNLNIEVDKERVEATLLWPERWNYDRLLKKLHDMLMDALGSSKFVQEYLNRPLDDASRKFHWEWLGKTFTEEDLKLRTVNRYAMFDVAESKNKGSDWTFKTLIDWDSDNNWFIQGAKRRKVNSPELIEWIFATWINDKPQVIGVEQVAFEDQVEPWLKIEAEKRGIFPIVVPLEHGGRSKEDRVVGALQGRFQNGKIFFKAGATDDTPILKGEIYDFPKGKNDDGVDSLAYGQQIGARPFSNKKEVPNSIQGEIDSYLKSQRKSVARRI